MVNVSAKPITKRHAVARAVVNLGEKAFRKIKENSVAKGDVLKISELAGIMGAKNTSSMIPLCHPLILRETNIQIHFNEKEHILVIRSYCEVEDKTGCEIEALVGASVAALNVYDMCKGISKEISIEKIELLEKSGGKSGDYNKVN